MKKKYLILFLAILLLALLPRVFLFENRISIFGDSARDVLVARQSLKSATLPPIASFSSAGPFVFAPNYYWLIMAVYALSPNSWPIFYYFLVLQSLLFLGVMMMGAKIIFKSWKGAFLAGFLVAISPRQIMRAMFMSQHTIVAICAALALFFLIKFISEKKRHQVFWCGFWISMGISMHYQAFGLLIFGLTALFVSFSWRGKIKDAVAFALGVFLPLAPLFAWDYSQHFANVNNFLDYLLIGQYRLYIPNRWLWHLIDFWPATFADIVGGNRFLAGLILYAALATLALFLIKRKLPKTLKFVFLFFIFFFVYLRYYRGEKFEGYLMYLHPLIFLICAWFFFQVSRRQKILAFLVLVVLAGLNFSSLKNYFSNLKFNEWQYFQQLESKLNQKAGKRSKFAVYDFAVGEGETNTSDVSQALTLYLDTRNRLDPEKGTILALCRDCDAKDRKCDEIKDEFLNRNRYHLMIFCENFGGQNSVARSPQKVQEEILFWWKKRPLTSTFNLKNYLLEKF